MPKHNLNAEPEEYSLKSKKLHIDVELSSPEPMEITLTDDLLSQYPAPGKTDSLSSRTYTSTTFDSADPEVTIEDENLATDAESKH